MPQPSLSRLEPIAVVGSGCKFPGEANSPSSLWKILENPQDLCREIPTDRFNPNGFYHHDGARHGTTNVRHSYFLSEDVRTFDAAFFNISPKEAASMDPQQRLLLETVYEALEAGGHTLEGLRGSDTSVYVGTMTVDYLDTLLRDHKTIPKYFATGINRAIISNRVSYFFDWHGPSMTIDTACSSSLIAVHQGVQSLRNGESQVSVACGTQVLLGYDMYIGESKLKMLSPNGKSRMWDSGADGYARGEGVAAIVMKRLSDAIADGDHIECIIRETGANQDGFSNGLTVPSEKAQATLIRQTYARAGLDPENNPHDRPQYFEAHGTGTQAGDPKEAAAIHECFGRYTQAEGSTPLYVGSIKTIIGHLEGAAGLAGLLKASTSLQKGYIPPNLSFNLLNPKIESYYGGLQVPTSRIKWPTLPKGVPRRASVNSFGFGGANAHAILEEYVPSEVVSGSQNDDDLPAISFTPFVFSALNEAALVRLLKRYSQYLEHGSDVNVSDLAWTLYYRRSRLPSRVAFSASSIEKLRVRIERKLTAIEENGGAAVETRASGKPANPRILGVFTGQGAQWPAMGAQLIRSSLFVRQRLQQLEESLATLPLSDRPSWNLREEILAGGDTSRIKEAALSQPLCTAIQIVLVDLLREASITFASVVGHSSGEIAAAYAAGFFSAHDAIRIAYYRGRFARLAGNEANGQKGAMLAAGISWGEAQDLVALEALKGRAAIAAHNSSSSVTLSGDIDAIAHAKKLLDEQKKFARLLQVDTAYHSHHMLPCGEPYLEALRACDIQVNYERNTRCTWFSSVVPNAKPIEPNQGIRDIYWMDNMEKSVMFADAVKNSVKNDDQINFVLEVGPHPALKGPATQIIADIRQNSPPYSGLLSRGADDVEAFSDALGSLWVHLGAKAFDLESLEKTINGKSQSHRLAIDLPSYQWDHGRTYWSESRRSKKIREQSQAPHELLGVLSPESNRHDIRWSNVLKLSEISWLEGHQLQGLVVLPAAAYISMAVEACRGLIGDNKIRLVELCNLSIPKAITFERHDDLGVEILTTFTSIEYLEGQLITADFRVYSAPNVINVSDRGLELVANATVRISLGDPDTTILPCTRATKDYKMSDIDPDRIYAAFSKLGYGYTGPFRGMTSTKRCLNHASALVDTYTYSDDESTFYLVHPSMLDVSIQSAMIAYSSPGDERLWSLHVPTHIRSVRINPEVCASLPVSGTRVPLSTTLDDNPTQLSASIEISSEDGQRCMIQVEDLVLKPFAPPTAVEDRQMYWFTQLDVATPDASRLFESDSILASMDEIEIASVCERISYFYIRKWKSELSDSDWDNCRQPHTMQVRKYLDRVLSGALGGTHFTSDRSWDGDSAQTIKLLSSRYSTTPAIRLISAIGESFLTVLRGETDQYTQMKSSDLLIDYHDGYSALTNCHSFLAAMVKQVVHRYPHANIIEIDAGRGKATKAIYSAIASSSCATPSYTLSDPSPSTVKQAAESFGLSDDTLSFKVFDKDHTPASQGLESQSYDVVIAPNILHTSVSVQKTLINIRQLLKPGGYLLLVEQTDDDAIRFTTTLHHILRWCLDSRDAHEFIPTMSLKMWQSALRAAGFGGIDTIKSESPTSTWPASIMAAQAINEQVLFLRRPLSSPSPHVFIDSLVILGTESLECSHIAEEVSENLTRFCHSITILDRLPTYEEALDLDPTSTCINLVDLDSPIFRSITSEKMEGLKRLFKSSRHILWLTRGVQQGEEPYHAASLAFCRSLSNEATHISVNALDVSETSENTPRVIAEQLLRQCALEEWDQKQLLWSKEPETYLQHGKLLIPRIRPNPEQNARLNATRRVVNKTISVSDSNFSMVLSDTTSVPRLLEEYGLPDIHTDKKAELIDIESSSLAALHFSPNTFLYLAIGKVNFSAQSVITVSTNNSRTVAPVVAIPAPRFNDNVHPDCLMAALTSEVLAMALVQKLARGDHALIHCADSDPSLAASLSRQAAAKDVRVSFSCSTGAANDLEQSWIILNPLTFKHAVRRLLLQLQPTHFLDLTAQLSTGKQRFTDTDSEILKLLPSECRVLDVTEFSRSQACLRQPLDRERLMILLDDAAATLSSTFELWATDIPKNVLKIDQIHDSSVPRRATTVVHWPVDGTVLVEVPPVDGWGLFSHDKTYVLFGLSGQVGQSLCQWMVSNGARYVCLISRCPKVDQGWLESFQAIQASVKTLAADITDRRSLDNILETIRMTCPPIAGIVNGANVSSDAPFDVMSAETMLQALRPKIEGSYNLDQAFFDVALDFFVLFSSISCVIGTSGQSNYVAANGYLNGLARQRRKRGLAASAIDIGLIRGIGLAEAAGQRVVDSLQKYAVIPLSETDLRLAFAESIRAGYTDPRDMKLEAMPSAVVTSGLRTIMSDEIDISWHGNPIFSHLVVDTKGGDAIRSKSKNPTGAVSVKEQIAATSSKEEALKVLKELFLAKLRIILQSADSEISEDVPLIELGIDSLAAVEVRSWFIKALEVDIPVLKLLGGSSLKETCDTVLNKLPEYLVSSTKSEDASAMSTQPQTPSMKATTDTDGSRSVSDDDNGSLEVITRKTSLESLRSGQKGGEPTRLTVKKEPISISQSRFWFLRLLVEDPTTFNVALSFRMTGHLRVGDLERALRIVTARHESLRTCFIGHEQEPDQAYQEILARSSIKLERKRINTVEDVTTEYMQLRANEFDLASGPLLRLILLTLSPTSHYLLVNYHHMIMDMASFQILTLELEKVYNGQPLGPPPQQYSDFSVAQYRALENGEFAEDLAYWRSVFPIDDQPPVMPLLPMALSSSRKALNKYAIHQVTTRLESDLAAQIKSISKAQKCTPFHFYLAAFKAMLFSFTGIQDLTIGIADANRNDSDTIGSIGLFLNLLTLRFRRQPRQRFQDAMLEARNTTYKALEHSRLPFDVLLKELGVARSSSHSPFFQVFFDYRQQTSDRQTWCNCTFDLAEMHPGRTAYDISLDVADLGSEVHATLRAQQCLYDSTGANLLLETYIHFIRTLVQNVSLFSEDISLFSEQQLARSTRVGLGPDMISDWPATLVHRVDQVAQKHPGDIGLKDGLGNSITYSSMVQRIDAIAEALSNQDIGFGSRVLVFQQASAHWVCSMLAVMRIGGVYVPLDLRNPMSRLIAQAGHCQPSAVLTDETTVTDATQLCVPVIIDTSHVPHNSSTQIPNSAKPGSAAAILYTSGSTGTPKGITIRHSSIRNEIEGYTKTYKLGAECVLQQSAFTFDFSMDQIFTGLVNGGTLYIVPWSQRGDPLAITEIMQRESITYTKVTPSEYSMWMQYGSNNLKQALSWRFAFGGGEPLTKGILNQFSDLGLKQLRLYNSYGPAEVSIASHKAQIDYHGEHLGELSQDKDIIPCGYSLPNYATYILDENQKPLPIGMPGEIVIGGPGVSFGYVANQELTSRVFLPNPYATSWHKANSWTQMHRTGDIGHLSDDGSLIFRNRIAGDTQVKLRGLRIDLRDVEANMLSASGGRLKEAVVTLRDGNPDYLVAHVVFSADVGDKNAFLQNLLSHLPIPQYMVPMIAVPLENLPLTSHSKVDRKAIKELALPQRAIPVDDSQVDSSQMTETMKQLRQLWRKNLPNSEKLGLPITASTSFFAIGGNSLLIVRLQSQIRQVLGVAVRLVDLLNANTLGQMARVIEESPGVGLVDWQLETAPPSIPNFLRNTSSDIQQGAKTVLLTGATGNLAKHILPLLLVDLRIQKVHCVAVRDKSRQASVLSDPKVVSHVGDLSLPLLGLSVDEFRGLADQVDVILHLGALRSFWDNYNILRSTNVHSTKELIKLAAPRRIPIHFISTSGVLSPEAVEVAGNRLSATTHMPPTNGSNGYVATKWASERLLERAASDPNLRLPSLVYRLLPPPSTHIQVGDARQKVQDEFMRCISLAGAVPDCTDWEGHIDLIPADTLAQWLCESMLSFQTQDRGGNETSSGIMTKFCHYESTITVKVDDIRAYVELAERGGQKYETLPLLKFMGQIKTLGFSYVLASQEATMRTSLGKLTSRR
ncbi:lovastatin nonaketide synthase [Nemania sp. FL0031]|nr:lovastatin nonaketide synthase [Nemania sp. FL0031]